MGKSFQQRLDGFVNTLTGLGGVKDKRLAAQFLPATQLDDETLDNLYNFNDLAHTVVSIYPEEALRQGYEINIEDDKEGDKAQKVQAKADDLGLNTSTLEGACWGRLFGGGAILLGFDDRQKQDTPLKEDKGGRLLFLRVLDKTELQVERYYQDPLKSDFGQPEVYRYTPTTMRGGVDPNTLIHESRLVMFPGAHTTKKQKQRNNGWDQSVLQAVYDVIRDFEAGFAGAGYLLNEASQAVYGVKGLLEILAGEGGQETLSKRMEIVEMSRSVARALLIDADGETFERKPVSFTGIPDVLDRLCSRLSAATGIPVTILMGQSPAGLNATGASDIRAFYDRVKSYQKDVIKPALERVLRIIMISELGSEPESWDIKFNSLYQPTDQETADLRQKVGATDVAYITAGVLTPEEVATNRFTPTGWSMETQIDLDLREQVDQANAEKALEQARNPETLAGVPKQEPAEDDPNADPGEAPVGKEDGFDPDQPRDENGQWSETGANAGSSSLEGASWKKTATGFQLAAPKHELSGAALMKEGKDWHVLLPSGEKIALGKKAGFGTAEKKLAEIVSSRKIARMQADLDKIKKQLNTDGFDPDQPRDEAGRFAESGAGPSSKEKWAKARAYVEAKKAKKEANEITGAKPVQQAGLNAPGKIDETLLSQLASETRFAKEGFEDQALIHHVYETAVGKGFQGSLQDFKAKLPHHALDRLDLVGAFDPEDVTKSETTFKVGFGQITKHMVRRRIDAEFDSDGAGTANGTDQADPDPESKD